MKNKINLLVVTSLALGLTASLSSCGNTDSKKWAYSKEEMANFVSMNAILNQNEDNTQTFSADTDVKIFDYEIGEKDVIVFDIDKVKQELENSNKNYADYEVLKKASVKVLNIKNLDDQDGFNITFEGNQSSSSTKKAANTNGEVSNNYGMLLHSSITSSNNFMIVNKYEENKNSSKDPQASFEENYVSKGMTWEDGGKFTLELISNIAMILAGGASENAAAVVGGIMGIFTSIGENFGAKEATIKDVMDKLKEVDNKIDDLSKKIDKNTQYLADEIVRVNANVDQANLNILNSTINDFATNSISKINTFNRNLADELGNYYKDFVNKPNTIKLVLTKDSKGAYTSTPLTELNDSSKYNFEVGLSDFTNAKKHLAQNNNVVQTGFIDELKKDIVNALTNNKSVPSDLKVDDLANLIQVRIIESFYKSYFSSHKDKAQELRNLMIDYAERLSGLNSKTSIVNTYISRLQYMYNFQSEIKPLVRSIFTNLLKTLDINTAIASQACAFASYDASELEKDYKSTRTLIQKTYTENTQKADSYSFITSSTLEGGFYSSKYTTTYSNPGNNCSLKVNFNTKKLELDGATIKSSDDDLSKHNAITEASHLKISTRWNLLLKTGSITDKSDYIHYLESANVISSKAISAAEFLYSMKKMDTSCYRILTSDRSERDLNSSDSSLKLNCEAKGNPSGDYFTLNSEYNYRGKNEASCWAGKTFEGKFINGSNGTSLGTQKIASWARYAESHWYWNNDEYWSFTNNDAYNYYFLISSVQ